MPESSANYLSPERGGLRALLGFTVTKVENATRSQMERAIAAFERQLSLSKTGLFYYAGHGIQVRDRNFMVLLDANPE